MFTDDYYIHLDAEKDQYCVVLQAKTGTTEETVYDQFEIELITEPPCGKKERTQVSPLINHIY